MRIIIAGSRTFRNYKVVRSVMDDFFNLYRKIKPDFDSWNKEIISGCAIGADELGERYAEEHNIKLTTMPANWDLYGKGAGFIRNREMAKYASQDKTGVLFAFWDGESNGTKNMIENAQEYGLDIYVIPAKYADKYINHMKGVL